MRKFIALLLILTLTRASYAALTLPALFNDGMVLQSGQKVPIWGWATAEEGVTITALDGTTISVNADKSGAFTAWLDPMPPSETPRTLSVQTKTESKVITDVLVGEVWLCAGQSNMAMPVRSSMDSEKEKAQANFPTIRMFTVEKSATTTPQNGCEGKWVSCTPNSVGGFSAVAYFFGRELRQQLNVPIGLIHSSWGGTRIEAWSPMESLEKFPTVMADKAHLDQLSELYDRGDLDAYSAQLMTEWEQEAKEFTARGDAPPKQPKMKKKPEHPRSSPNYQANLYNGMIHPLVPYGIRGAIWYQGEHNTNEGISGAIFYRDLIENLVTAWRKKWNYEFPFYAVQLPNYEKTASQLSWAYIRESFLKFGQQVPNTGIAVTIDAGEPNNIHPKNKQTVGYRLAQQALAKTYGKDLVADGPVYTSMQKMDGKIALSFIKTGSGLITKDGAPLKQFSIAGEDRKFHPANAVISGNTVIVDSPNVLNPEAVRYAWADNPMGCNLFNKEGFPASPFRTDSWPTTTPPAKE